MAAAADHQKRARWLALLPDLNIEGAYLHMTGQVFVPKDSGYFGLKAQWAVLDWGATALAARSASALAAAVLIIALFFTALGTFDSPWLIGSLFVCCMACLVSSLAVFIHDVNESLTALKLELSGAGMGEL